MSKTIGMVILVAITLHSWAAAKATSHFNIDLAKGEHKNLFLKEGVFLSIAPTSELRFSIQEEVLWSALKVGDKLLVGTGNGGRLYVFDLQTDKLVHQFTIARASEVTALLLGPKGRVFVATGPQAKVHELSKDFKSVLPTPVATIPGQFIWSMSHDETHLYLASGKDGKGLLYKANPSTGQATQIFETDETNVLMVEFHAGKLYASTSGQGYLYEMGTDGQQAKILYDAGQDISHFAIHKGRLYLGSKADPRQPEAPPQPPGGNNQHLQNALIKQLRGALPPGAKLNVQDNEERAPKPNAKPQPPPQVASLNVVRIDLNTGHIKNLLTLSKGKSRMFVSALLVNPNQNTLYFNVYKEKDKKSLVYAAPLDDVQSKSVYSAAPAFSTMSFVGDAEGTFFYAANKGDLYELKQNLQEGHYLSEVLDAKETVRWGSVRYTMYGFSAEEANQYLNIFARTGNTSSIAKDGQWSDWQALQSGRVVNGQSRFVQLKFVMKPTSPTTSPMIEGVRLHYGRGNLPTEIRQVSWDPTQQAIHWQVHNPDKDQMLYSIFYSRGEGDQTLEWTLLKEDLRTTRFNTPKKNLPDGEYRFKVVASDILANGDQEKLTTEKISKKYIIDNTAPEVVVGDLSKTEVQFTVKDAFSMVRSVRYAKNSMHLDAFPIDGLFDSNEERFVLSTKNLDSEHLILHVVDAQGNSLYKTIELPTN